MSVFVLGKNKKPLMPTSEKHARLLLEKGRAVVVKVYPFTIRLKDRSNGEIQPVRIKFDPGSKQTGVALVRENKIINTTGKAILELHVLNLFQINHRGLEISAQLTA